MMAGDKRKEMKCFLFSFIWNNLGWFLLPSRVVRVWMNCIRAISFQRSWKAHIIHLARKVDIFVFRDFGGFKFFDQNSTKCKKIHSSASLRSLTSRSVTTVSILNENGWVVWDSVEYWRLSKPVFSYDLVHMFIVHTGLNKYHMAWPHGEWFRFMQSFGSCVILHYLSTQLIIFR